MSKLTKVTNDLISLWEESRLNISLLSFLVLEYHASTQQHDVGNEVLRDVYGYTNEQLNSSYSELEYQGYIAIKGDFISFTSKMKSLFTAPQKRMSGMQKMKLEENFELFWKAYPIKVGKKRAKFEWMKLMPEEELVATIIKAIEVQKKYKADSERSNKFVPEFQHAERWIKNERYEDEYVAGTNFIKRMNNKTSRDER